MFHSRKEKPKRSECKKRIKNILSTINELERNLIKSQQTDRQILMAIRLDHLKDKNIITQLEEVQKENKQLLDMMQLQDCQRKNMSRTNSSTSCSTMSLVNLQYKYEELLANQNDLLKLLEMRLSENRKYHEENCQLQEEIESLKLQLQNSQEEFSRVLQKMKDSKVKKSNKISKLKNERDTLKMVHSRFVSLLNQQFTERDDTLCEILKTTPESDKALLIQEIRKNNALLYENFQMQQKIDYLQSIMNTRACK
ncbi:uncharacterized protein isoform X1 [Leptinotarsa decemlineata]|uniref:uncharacterized protein isoform X1 n=2 Tax=Leptinotarsa decemlineata TaxID=7539 RepID=UPI003D3050CA